MENALTSVYFWRVITHLGSGGILMPLLTITAIGLWRSHQRTVVRTWLLAITLAVVITMATKVLFFGWGFGIAWLNFTGLSGHTVLATSVFPVFLSWLGSSNQPRYRRAGAVFGLMLGVVVGMSRVVLGAHSASEVVAAWFIGAAVSGISLTAPEGPAEGVWFARFTPLILLLALGTTTSNYLPTHDWEIDLSLFLSGRDKPYTRYQLLRPARSGIPSSRMGQSHETQSLDAVASTIPFRVFDGLLAGITNESNTNIVSRNTFPPSPLLT
jgi:membrane-associated phospholipid phosphatase